MFLIPHLGTIIWTTIIFGIVFFILKKFAWGPLIEALENREKAIEKALKSAADAEKRLSTLKVEQQTIITLAKQEKEHIVHDGVAQRDQIIASAKDKAQIEANKIVEEARKKIAREREAALIDMKNQIATLSVDIATKLVKADLEDIKRHQKLVAELIKDIELN